MKNILKMTLMAFTIVSMASCSMAGPLMVTDNPGGANAKTGEATMKVILGIKPLNADISIATAAKNGNITKVSTVDSKIEAKMFITKYTTVVTGE